MAQGIYVEALIDGPVEDVWQRSLDPKQHARWDLRFSRIDHLPRPDEAQPQRFRYATRIGFGLSIEGTGESVGSAEKGGVRTSSLRFGSQDPKSLIRDGSGYWRFVPTEGGTRFLTWYDYRVRFGLLGRLLDLLFRPLLGWATALSFDRLRLWIEDGVPPETSLRDWWVHLVARLALAFVFVYQGLVPKLLYHHPDELAMMRAGGIPAAWASTTLDFLGAAESAFGLFLLAAWRWRWPLLITVPVMVAVAVGVALTAPGHLVSAFNVVSLNVSVAGLALTGWLAAARIPSARRCLRRPAQPAKEDEG